MEKTVSVRGVRLLYLAVSACFIVLTAWLYWKEGPYVKAMDISVMPESGRFQADVLADGKNIEVSAEDKEVRLFVDESSEGDKTRLLIHGECREDRTVPVSIRVVSDCDNHQEKWSCQLSAGIQVGDITFVSFKNRARGAYPWLALFATVFMAAVWFGGEKNRVAKELEACAGRAIEKLEQEPGMEKCCREGRRLFAAYEKQEVLMLMLTGWMWIFWVFWVLHEMHHKGDYYLFGGYIQALAAGVLVTLALKLAASMRWRKLSIELLTKDCRPVTGAVAYLLMGNYGIEKRWKKFILYHNGASGLYRSGHCREALEISDLAWKLPKRKPQAYITYIHSSLRYQCLKVLEETEAAEAQRQQMEALLEEHPGWRKQRNIQRFLGIQDICHWIETGEIEQAERSAGEILGQWREGYYRLTVLGLMAELKEFLGKEEEAAKLREEILIFSPENKEVRQVMGEGRLSYRERPARAWDPVLMTVCAVCGCVIGICLFMM